jgi:hypothetical protein
VKTDTGNLATRITSTLFSGITSLAQWLGLISGKQAGNATALTEINATGAGGGGYDPTTDSLEAIRDRGDLSWATATNVTVSAYATGQDPWSIIKAATPSATPTLNTIEAKFQLIGADEYTDKTTDATQWHTVYVVAGSGIPGTGYTLATKKLFDSSGGKITDTSTVVAQASQ